MGSSPSKEKPIDVSQLILQIQQIQNTMNDNSSIAQERNEKLIKLFQNFDSENEEQQNKIKEFKQQRSKLKERFFDWKKSLSVDAQNAYREDILLLTKQFDSIKNEKQKKIKFDNQRTNRIMTSSDLNFLENNCYQDTDLDELQKEIEQQINDLQSQEKQCQEICDQFYKNKQRANKNNEKMEQNQTAFQGTFDDIKKIGNSLRNALDQQNQQIKDFKMKLDDFIVKKEKNIEFSSNIKYFEEEFYYRNQQISELYQKCQQQEINNLQGQLDLKEQELESTKEYINELNIESEELKKHIQQYDLKILQLNKDMEVLKNDLENSEQKNLESREAINQKEKARINLEVQMQNAEIEILQLNSKLLLIQKKNEENQFKIKFQSSSLTQLYQKHGKLSQEFDISNKKLEKADQDIQNKDDKLRIQLKKIQIQNHKIQLQTESILDLTKNLKEKSKQLGISAIKLTNISSQLKLKKLELNYQLELNKEQREIIEQQKNIIDQKKKELYQQQLQARQYNETLAETEKALSISKTDLEQMYQQIREQEQLIQEKNEKIKVLQNENVEFRNIQNKNEVAKLQREIETLNKLIEDINVQKVEQIKLVENQLNLFQQRKIKDDMLNEELQKLNDCYLEKLQEYEAQLNQISIDNEQIKKLYYQKGDQQNLISILIYKECTMHNCCSLSEQLKNFIHSQCKQNAQLYSNWRVGCDGGCQSYSLRDAEFICKDKQIFYKNSYNTPKGKGGSFQFDDNLEKILENSLQYSQYSPQEKNAIKEEFMEYRKYHII